MKLINICSCRKVILRPNKYIILKKVRKLKKKIIKVVLLLILLLSIFNINTYATINTNYGDFPEYVRGNATYTTENNYYIILNANTIGDYKIFIIPKNIDFYLYKDSDNKLCVFNKESASKSIFHGTYNINNGYISVSERVIASNNYYSNTSFILNTSEDGSFEIDGLQHLIYSEIDIYNGVDGFTNNDVYIKARVLEEQPPIEDEEQEELSTEDLLKYIKNSSDTTNVILISVYIFIFLVFILRINK